MEENRGPESITSSQKGEKSVGITTQEGEPGGKKSSSIGKGNKKEELLRKTHGEEDPSGMGPIARKATAEAMGSVRRGAPQEEAPPG